MEVPRNENQVEIGRRDKLEQTLCLISLTNSYMISIFRVLQRIKKSPGFGKLDFATMVCTALSNGARALDESSLDHARHWIPIQCILWGWLPHRFVVRAFTHCTTLCDEIQPEMFSGVSLKVLFESPLAEYICSKMEPVSPFALL